MEKIKVKMDETGKIRVEFKYSKEAVALIKSFKGAKWHPEEKYWSIEYCEDYKEKISLLFQENNRFTVEFEDGSIKINFIKYMENRRYSEKTVRMYLVHIENFLKSFNDDEIKNIDRQKLSDYINSNIVKKGYSFSYQNQAINAIKMYLKTASKLNSELKEMKIERPKTPRKLPNVLSKEEIIKIVSVLKNLKHRTVISLIYSAGLRISEAVKMEIRDIDFNRKIINIKDAKGKKDRQTALSLKIEKLLLEYMAFYKPSKYIFEGAGGEKYSERSIQQVFTRAVKEAGIKKEVSVHSLRHSYATHLHEAGTDIKIIQELLGHESTKTTEIYTHVSRKVIQNVKSPFDDL